MSYPKLLLLKLSRAEGVKLTLVLINPMPALT
jgi:hypothetical protein